MTSLSRLHRAMPLFFAAALTFSAGCAMAPRYRNLPAKPPRPHSFYELQRRFVAVEVPGRPSAVAISYVEAGEGPPLLLIHGLMTNAYSFRYVIPALAKHYRVIVPDLPGAGRSASPPDLGMTPGSVAALLSAFQVAVGAPRAYVVGNSLGGYLSLWLWLEHPERVERLAVMHAPGFPELRLKAMQLVLRQPFAPRLLRLVTRNPEQFVVNNVHYRDKSVMSQEEAREYGAIFRDPARAALFARILRESMDTRQMPQLHQRLQQRTGSPEGKIPVLLLWAKDDVLVSPAYGPRYQALLPDAKLIWVDDSGHFMQVDAPETTVRELLEFGRVSATP